MVQLDRVEEVETLVPQMALEAIPAQSAPLGQAVPLFDGLKIFVHAPQYHWHVAISEGVQAVDQEVKEHIVSIANLLDRFGHQR